ncbi:MAG: class I SAM-dependent methyltransferase [Desulfomonile tiedjei]|uniref:Class I SAM-dependent methyltransferase n=1 Tax=Desulfomonile tiedjei TaxID=2358 RepID=A0A9D6Z4N9_9BACT|nr:class I SAM-dependent methyltransferase [Desulfomonile tiedjei]
MRIAGRMKMGYYPTPARVVDYIKKWLSFPPAPFTALDPCCGEGIALEHLVRGSEAITYGVELDEQRADAAQDRIQNVLKCGIGETRIAHQSYSLLFLNPPYDEATLEEDADIKTERQEKAFLRMTVPYLVPGGVIIYIIPQKRLNRGIARLLASRFERVNVFRFPDPEYDDFQQVVVFGVRKSVNSLDDGVALKLQNVPNRKLKPLPETDTAQYSVPPAGPLKLFRSTVIDPEELAKQMAQSPLWRRFDAMTTRSELKLPRPPLPLHSGHLGLLLAAGKLDGVVGEGPDRHVVKGKVTKVVSRVEEYKGDVLEQRELDRYVVSIKIMNRNGEIRELT